MRRENMPLMIDKIKGQGDSNFLCFRRRSGTDPHILSELHFPLLIFCDVIGVGASIRGKVLMARQDFRM